MDPHKISLEQIVNEEKITKEDLGQIIQCRRPHTVYKINHLTKIYKTGNVLANDDISLEIKRGEIFGIFGPNGASKTTLVRQMAG